VNIPLVSGWQIIGYPVADGDIRNVADVFAPLVDPNGDGDFADSKIIIVKNGPGQVYWPQFGVNTIGNMVPGQGYQVRMSESDTLTFNEPSNQNGQN
jgi:hypothetical protein